MNIIIKSTKTEWEGLAYISIHGDINKFKNSGFGQIASNFKDAYIILKNKQNNKECGGIIKAMTSNNEEFIEIDSCLLKDLSISVGSNIEISPLKAIYANQVRIALSKSDLNQHEVQNLCV